MWTRVVLTALCAMPLAAQSAALERYLELDGAQKAAIDRNNNEHRVWRELKEDRVYRLRAESSEEGRKSPLDPAALGLRYAEIEAICREIDERELALVRVNREALNEQQKVRLAALEAAMKLAPLANGAIGQNLISAAPVDALSNSSFTDLLLGRATGAWPEKRRSGACAAQESRFLLFAVP